MRRSSREANDQDVLIPIRIDVVMEIKKVLGVTVDVVRIRIEQLRSLLEIGPEKYLISRNNIAMPVGVEIRKCPSLSVKELTDLVPMPLVC